MKKDFEQAYRELAQNEAPDLWDRIEAGLSDKSAPQKQKKIARLLPYTKYITVAAALLCIAILVPVLGTISRSSKGGYSGSDTAVAENSAGAIAAPQAPAAEDPAQDDVAEYARSASDAGAATAEAPVTADNAGSIAGGIAESTKEKVEEMEAADSMDAGMTEGAMLQSSESARDMEDKSASAKLMDTLLISNVVIYVTEVNRRELTEDIDEAGTLYTFLVEEEPSGVLSVGEEYVLFVPAYSSYAFMQDGVYELDLGYREGEGYSFVLERYHGEVE